MSNEDKQKCDCRKCREAREAHERELHEAATYGQRRASQGGYGHPDYCGWGHSGEGKKHDLHGGDD